ncbi:MAG TPA: hypothetical protein PKJ41_12200 [Bryobacteraceae bacterium]|nr:hypothetical protein [Bryobacteraceae bacterium]
MPTSKTEDQHSGRSRVTPTFRWLRDHGGAQWVAELLNLADGISAPAKTGRLVSLEVGEEREVPASAARLAWMIRNAHKLAPLDGRKWRRYLDSVILNPRRDETLQKLDAGITHGIPAKLILEGRTHADCLIETESALVWIEGKRNDWLSSGTTWDLARDQLARNLEAAWILASAAVKDWWLLICHEHDLKHHEEHLIAGYRQGSWSAGLPHLPVDVREAFRPKIGTLRWGRIFEKWPGIRTG